LIVVPGVQGRWEWMRPALQRLAMECRTISYTLAGDFGSDRGIDAVRGFDTYLRQLDSILDRSGIARAAVCGVSYGGFVALRYAATRPERVSALILVSAPAPGWRPSARQQRYIQSPWLSTPAFVLTSPARVWPEIRAAIQDWGTRLRFLMTHGLRVLMAPMIPSLMAARVRLQQELDFCSDCARVRAPTLIVTGEEGLDFVVPVEVTQRYRNMIPGSRYEQMSRTGHIGMLTRPDRFARIVCDFVHANHH
jgi:pimeloyl-ACP methyl ester carboxylesterase